MSTNFIIFRTSKHALDYVICIDLYCSLTEPVSNLLFQIADNLRIRISENEIG